MREMGRNKSDHLALGVGERGGGENLAEMKVALKWK